jgi:hypothetical protein
MNHIEVGRLWNENAEAWSRCPHLQDAQVVPYFLHIRARKAR